MRIGVLGPLEVEVGSMSRRLGSETQRTLLAALTVHAGSVVSTDRLIDIIWGEDPPASALRSLRTYIYRLRSALGQNQSGREPIVTRPPGYVLDPSALTEVDAWRHEALLSDATETTLDPSSRLHLVDEALSLWRGPAYAEFADEEFARGEALRLDESKRVAAEVRCESLIDLGRHDEAIGELDAIVDRHPHRERPRELLMRALYRSGRHGDALAVCNDLRTRLRDELGLDIPPVLAALEVDILRQAPDLAGNSSGPDSRARPGATALPAERTRLVGRDDVIRSLNDAIETDPLVTLVGPGGVGKTRVALAVARARHATHPAPVWWCELAPVDDGRDVGYVVASSLQARPDDRPPIDAVVEHLRHRSGLLVLDNCEHVIEGVLPLVQTILNDCPNIAMLLTSRSVLEVMGERVLRLQPLEATGEDPDRPDSALEMLLDRIRTTREDLVADRGERRQLAELCRRLDGLPLAIELAASRLRSINPVDLLDRLDERLDVVGVDRGSGGRHRTLRSVLEWSLGLLSRTERQLFLRLSVFAGTFTLDAAEQVASGEGIARDEVVDLLARLVDHSLVVAVPGGGRVRYVLLETLRIHGSEVLDHDGEHERWRGRHAAYHVALAEDLAADVRGPAEATAVARLDAELDNLRAAHHWALDHDPDLAMRLPAALFRYALWRLRGEVFAWAEEAAGLPGATTHVHFPTVAGMLAWGAGMRGAREDALEWVRQGLAVLDDDDPRGLALMEARMHVALWEGRLDDCLRDAALAVPLCRHPSDLVPHYVPGLALTYAGRPAEALEHLDGIELLAEADRNPTMRALVQYSRGEALLLLDPGQASRPLELAAELADEVGNHVVRGVADVALISLQARLGTDGPEAIAAYGAVIDRLYGAGDWTHLWTGLRGLVDMLVARDHHEDAARLVGALRGAANAPPIYGEDAERLAEAEARLSEVLGSERFGRHLDEGMRMSDEAAIAFAREAIARAALMPGQV